MSKQPALVGQAKNNARQAAKIADLRQRVKELEQVSTTIGPESIAGAQIAPDSITTNNIAAGAITTDQLAAGSVTADAMAANSVTAGSIAANSITTAALQAGAVTATTIAANAITSDKVNANAITAGKIAANAIETANISAGAVVAAHISAGAITANALAADSVTANAILARTITAGHIASNTITANEIAATTITASQIAANTITAGQIATGAITTDKIGANQVTAEKITTTTLAAITGNLGNITAGNIVGASFKTSNSGARAELDTSGLRAYGLDGTTKTFEANFGSGIVSMTGVATLQAGSVIPGSTITGQVPANAIPALGGGNLYANSSFESALSTVATANGGAVAQSTAVTPYTGTQTLRVTLPTFAGQAGANLTNGGTVANLGLQINSKYIFSAWLFNPASGGATQGVQLSAQGTGVVSTPVNSSVVTTTGAWTRIVLPFTTTGTSTGTVLLYALSPNPTSGQIFYVDAVQLESGEIATSYAPRVGEIAASSITDTMLATGISAAKITNGTITGTQITNGAITANKLNVVVGGGNLAANSSFEDFTTTPLAGWSSLVGTTVVTNVSTQARTGTRSLSITRTDASSPNAVGPLFAVAPSTSYTITAYFRAAATARSVQVGFQPYNGGAAGTNVYGTAVADTTTGWTRAVYTLAVPASGVTHIRPTAQIVSGAVNEVHFMDDVQVEIGDVATAYAPATNEILPGTIVASHIATDTITSAQIAADAITSSEILAGAVTTAKMTADSINGDRISAGTLNATKIVSGSIDTLQIAAGAIKTNQIDAGAVTANKLTVTFGGGNRVSNSRGGAAWNDVDVNWTSYMSVLGNVAEGVSTPTSFGVTSTSSTQAAYIYREWSHGQAARVLPNTSYVMSAYVKGTASAVGLSGKIEIRFADGSVSTTYPSANFTITGTWQRVSVKVTSGPNDTNAGYSVQFTPTAAGQGIYVTDIQFEQGEVAAAYSPKPDEVLPGTIGPTQITPNSITSDQILARTILAADIATGTLTANEIASATITGDKIAANTITANKIGFRYGGTNLLPNSSFEDFITGWTVYGNNGTPVIISGSGRSATTKGIRITTNGSAPDRSGVYRPISLAAGGTVKYTLSGYFCTGSAVGNGKLYVEFSDGSSVLLTDSSAATPLTTAWQRISFTTASVPAAATTATIYAWIEGAATNAVFYIDDIQFELGEVATDWSPYVDPTVIDGSTITGATIRTGPASGGRVQISTTGGLEIFNDATTRTFQILPGGGGLDMVATGNFNNASVLDLNKRMRIMRNPSGTQIGSFYGYSVFDGTNYGEGTIMEANRISNSSTASTTMRTISSLTSATPNYAVLQTSIPNGTSGNPSVQAFTAWNGSYITRTIMDGGGRSDFVRNHNGVNANQVTINWQANEYLCFYVDGAMVAAVNVAGQRPKYL